MEPAIKKMDEQESPKPQQEGQAAIGATIEQTQTETSPGRRRRQRNTSGPPGVSVNMDELRELIHLIRENEFTEFELEREGFRVKFRRGVESDTAETRDVRAAAGVMASTGATASGSPSTDTTVTTSSAPAHPGAKAQTAASEDQDLHIIPSPIVGTFYRAASPNAESFVKIGSPVEPDTIVCIIEAMKLMNEIQAETSGEVAKIYVENGQPVEYGQPLFGIKK
ncbi:MAG: acetyl-CoA carboxylase biotin carboxyl carrier protein [Pyrinomonadaceae bacterium]